MRANVITFFLYMLGVVSISSAQTSSLVSIDSTTGKLCYTADANGNVIPDFSMVGYHQGNKVIPDVPVKVTLKPGTEDRRADIQNAIDELAAMTPDSNGHRGAILLQAGYYQVSGGLQINTSGIVIRGEGKDAYGTVVEITGTQQSTLFSISGRANVVMDSSTEKKITDSYVPIGAKTITVESGHTFQVGDRVLFTLKTNAAWIAALGMDQLESRCGSGHGNWGAYQMSYKRKITNVKDNLITLDAPVVDPVDDNYNSASLAKYTWDTKIEECGVENIRLLSSYASETDESHGWVAVALANIENAWVRNVEAYYFGGGCVHTVRGAYQITVENCGMYEYKSILTGGRRYGFNSDDCDLVLFKNCVSDEGRHSFVQGSQTPGPNVYTNCMATNAKADEGPHHRWSTGTLWDVISTDGAINVQNRLCSGSGHGWAGAQQVLWNCTAPKIILHDPPSNCVNWAIGCTANITNIGDYDGVVKPIGVVESKNNPIADIPSLYMAQLMQRFPVKAPSKLSVSQQYKQNDLRWTDNTDTETGFIVERSVDKKRWTTLENLAANTTFYADTAIAYSNTFYYRIRAINVTALSVSSNIVKVTNAKLINTIADASVANMGNRDINYGADSVLTTLFTASGLTNMAYLKFDLALLPKELTSVKLRVKTKKTNKNAAQAYFVQDDSWDEQAITWNSKPQKSTSLGRVSANEEDVFEWDILDLVNTEIEGDKILTVVILATEMNKSLEFYSREGAADNMLLQPSLAYKSLPLMELKVLEDSYVSGGSNADTNYGSENKLAIEATQTTNNNSKEAYLKFDLSNLPANIGTCRLLLRGISDEENRYGLYEVSNDSWSENNITWNNKPDAGNLVDTASNSKIEFVEFDITEEVKNQLGGDKILSVRIAGLSDVAGGFYSKEGAGMHENYKPVIVVEDEQKTITVGTNSLQNPKYEKDLLVYPNPANDILYIKGITNDEIINVYNIMGQKMLDVNYSGGINISILKPGIYFLGINMKEEIKVKKFIKE
jgi:hypothetical protein